MTFKHDLDVFQPNLCRNNGKSKFGILHSLGNLGELTHYNFFISRTTNFSFVSNINFKCIQYFEEKNYRKKMFYIFGKHFVNQQCCTLYTYFSFVLMHTVYLLGYIPTHISLHMKITVYDNLLNHSNFLENSPTITPILTYYPPFDLCKRMTPAN